MSASSRKTLFSKLRFALLYAAYLGTAMTLLVYAFFYRPFIADLRAARAPETDALDTENLSPELIARVGWFHNQKKSAFHRFQKTKKPGVRRLCAFGDSFTHGDEVQWNVDYPSLLMHHAKTLGLPIEVLNFGSSWWGFHQTHMLWEALAAEYECDTTLLGPMTFYPSRDSAFGHTDFFSPYNLHALYVLDHGVPRRIDVIGSTYSERFDAYYGFFPARRYLRYDRQSPTAMTALLPRNRQIENPFYYAPPWKETAQRSYDALARSMLETAPEMRFLLTSYASADWSGEIDHPRWDTFRPDWPMKFPYLAPRGHNSAWGNDLLARQILGHLFPQTQVPLPIFRTTNLPPSVAAELGEGFSRRPLSDWASLTIDLNEITVGQFARVNPLQSDHDGTSLHGSGIVALLGLQGADGSPLDAFWIAIDRALRPGEEVRLRVHGEEAVLGIVHEPVEGLNLGVVEVPGLVFEEKLLLRGHPQISDTDLSDPQARILLGGTAYALEPPRMLRTGLGGYLAPEELPQHGVFEITAVATDGSVVRRPFAVWEWDEVSPTGL